ncbi:N-acetylmuramoyl-L-alanine amidase [Saccharopolyspora griseoalba]|uniref:N-acetylmuramoyl-L-alanine amidase n=1 Tax=Saccharopolyspora griseoalba TaxID=1431848 RepID=A0ABW2LFC4_9PSEU
MTLGDVRVARRVLLAGGLAATAVTVAGVPAVARPRVLAPSISSTAEWDARDAAGSIEVLDSKPDKIIVHHTATSNAVETSQAHAFELCRQVQTFHMDSNGWVDTGQNFTNSRGGYLMEGRHESLAALRGGSQHVKGAHAGEQNSVALGIENEGTYTEAEVPSALWDSLVELCSYMVSQYGIEAGAIYGHRDHMATACPGDVLYARLPELREAVAARAGVSVVQPVSWPLVRPGEAGARVSALQWLLRAAGFAVPVDGAFGAGTQRAAGEVVRRRGAVGPSCSASRVAEPGLFGGLAWELVTPVLARGASGDAVRAAQVLLGRRGVSVAVDGVFGAGMLAAVREFQGVRGVAVSGVVDGVLWRSLLG